MQNQKSLVERIHAGEFDNSFLQKEQDPARVMFDRQIGTLYAYIDALERARSSLPVREFSRACLRAELERKRKFREALEEAFRMQEHAKANMLWNRAWGLGEEGGLEHVAFLYATLLELVK
jgi:chromatin segregation and condensation protein Rec8/ScpA/Scc1 (kleisin family)